MSQAGAEARSFPLIGCQLMRGRPPICSHSPHNSFRLRGSEVKPGITSIRRLLWTLIWVDLVTHLSEISSFLKSVYMPHGCNTGFYCSVEKRATPMYLLPRRAVVGVISKWNYFFFYDLREITNKLNIPQFSERWIIKPKLSVPVTIWECASARQPEVSPLSSAWTRVHQGPH